MEGSPKYALNGTDLLKIGKGALLAIGGALVTYLSVEVVPNIDQSATLGAIVAGSAAVVLNVLRKYLGDNRATAAGA